MQNQQTNTLHFAAFLQEALNYVNASTPTEINSGGCGVFAKLLSEHLSTLGIECQIYALYSSEDDDILEERLMNFISTGNDVSDCEEGHIVVKVDELYLDSTGIINDQINFYRSKVLITKEQLDDLVDHGRWNPVFDRDVTPLINKKLDEVFDKTEEFVSGMFHPPLDINLTDKTVNQMKRQHISSLQALFQ